MPASGSGPIRSPSSTAPISAACTVSVLAKVLPTAKFRKPKSRSSSSVPAICPSAPESAATAKTGVTPGAAAPPTVSATASPTASGAAKTNRA